MFYSRILFFVVAFVLIVSCEKVDDINGVNSLTSSVVYENSFDVTVQLNTENNGEVVVNIYDKDSGEIIQSIPVRISEGSRKICIYGLDSATNYYYEVVSNNSLLSNGEFSTLGIDADLLSALNVGMEGNFELSGGCILLNRMNQQSGLFLFNEFGEPIWVRKSANFIKMAKVTQNGTILTLEDDTKDMYGNGNIILETTFTGDTLARLVYGQNGFDRMAHHDALLLNNGNIAFITNVSKQGVVVDGLTVLDRNGSKVWEWDMGEEVLPIKEGVEFVQPWGNSLTMDENGDYIVSFRNLNQVWCIDSENGDVKYKLGENGDFVLGSGEWFVNQHHAQKIIHNQMLLFDNGNKTRPFSRIVSYGFDTSSLKASIDVDIKLKDDLYSAYMSSVQMLDNGFLIGSSMTKQIVQVDKQGNEIARLAFGDRMFRVQVISMKSSN